MLRFSMFRAAVVGTLFLAGLAGLTGPARAVTPVSPAAAFVDGIDDLPLMPGLSPVTEEGLVFDKPGGRIVHAVARGTVTPAAVRQFYADTAPQLGWRGPATTGSSARARCFRSNWSALRGAAAPVRSPSNSSWYRGKTL
jgi:hypothetical protein